MSSTISKFYNTFWTNKHCQAIFLKHKEELLEKSEIDLGISKKSFYQPRFVLSNSLTRNNSLEKIEERIKSRTIDADYSLSVIASKNFDEQKIEKYFKSRFRRTVDKISNQLNGGRVSEIKFLSELALSLVSEKRLIKFLKKYHILADDVESTKGLSTIMKKIIDEELSKNLSSEQLIDITTLIGELANYYGHKNFTELIQGNRFYLDRIYDKENFKDRIDLFDLLYESKVLIGGVYKAYYECTHCHIDTFSGIVSLNVPPKKIKLKCPSCNKEVFYVVPYKIDNDIFQHIISKDGLLFQAIKHLLVSKNIAFKENMNALSDIEIDIAILNKSNHITDIVEIKMFKSDRTEDVILSNHKEGLRKFIAARKKLAESNLAYNNVNFHFVTNTYTYEIGQKLKSDFNTELSSKFTLNNADTFMEYINQISPRNM